MRWMLRIFFWLGLGLSTVLFVGTVVVWVRSIGHDERWGLQRFEFYPYMRAKGNHTVFHWGQFRATNGRLWIQTAYLVPRSNCVVDWCSSHAREPYSAAASQNDFKTTFRMSRLEWYNGWAQGRRCAGVAWAYGQDGVDCETNRPAFEAFYFACPFWMLAVLFGLWPVCFAARRVFRRRRYGAGLCPQCGYDLRATPDRCPECGRAVDAGRGSRENA